MRSSWGVGSSEIAVSAPGAAPGSSDNLSLQLFLEDLGLGSFLQPFLNFGFGSFADVLDAEMLDDGLCRDLGMSDAQVSTFRKAITAQAALTSKLSSADPSEAAAKAGQASHDDAGFGQYGGDDDGSSGASGKPKFSASAAIFGKARPPKEPAPPAAKYGWSEPGGGSGGPVEVAVALDSMVPAGPPPALRAAAPVAAAPPPPPAAFKPPPPAAPQPVAMAALPVPPTPPPALAREASLPPLSDVSPAALAQLATLPPAEQPKARAAVDKTLAGLEIALDGMARVDSGGGNAGARRAPWKAAVGGLLPPGAHPQLAGARPQGAGGQPGDPGGLALFAAADKIIDVLGSCDRARVKVKRER